MKKSFTLLEVIISIGIFSVLMIFLYKTLDQVSFSNNTFKEREKSLYKNNKIYKIMIEDTLESSKVEILEDKNKNSVLKLISTNTFHNPSYKNITYLIDASNTLVRVESKLEFLLDKTTSEFYKDVYIDKIQEEVIIFSIISIKKDIKIAIKQENGSLEYINLFIK